MHPPTAPREDPRGPSPSSTRTCGIGTVLLDRYEVFGSAEGGFSTVLFVTDAADKRRYAVKIPHDPGEAFASEVDFWIRIGPHPHIVAAHFVEPIDGRPALFMDYVPHRLPPGPVDARQAERWIYQLCLAMKFANRNGEVAHLDLKPANLLVDSAGNLRVTDFGLAQRVRMTGGKFPKIDSATWQYAAPEIYEGHPGDSRSDIFSVGLIFHELLYGRLPYPFDAGPDPAEAYRRISEFHRGRGMAAVTANLYYGPDKREFSVLLSSFLQADRSSRTEDFARALSMVEQAAGFGEPGPLSGVPGRDRNIEHVAALCRVGRHEDALTRLNRLIVVDPGEAAYWREGARIFRETGNLKYAEKFERAAARLDAAAGNRPERRP